MKNKIILLLVLLIPSLCFGKSLKIEAIRSSDQKYRITFLSSSKEPEGAIDFFTREGNIDFSKEDEFAIFSTILLLHFPNRKQEILKKYGISKNSIVSYFLIKNLILDLAVVNNYQITSNDTSMEHGRYMFVVFLYKPDK